MHSFMDKQVSLLEDRKVDAHASGIVAVCVNAGFLVFYAEDWGAPLTRGIER